MFLNYIKITLRNILKYKAYSLINVLGLALGVAIFFIAIQFTSYHMSWDGFQSKADHLYRVHQKFNDGGTTATISYPIKDALVADYPEIQEATSFSIQYQTKLFLDNKQVVGEKILFIEPSFFDLFDVNFLKGTKEQTQAQFASNPQQAIITAEYAKILFGDEDPIGKTFTLGDKIDGKSFSILGVVEKYPKTSHFDFNILVPEISHPMLQEVKDNWNNPVVYTYLYIPDKSKGKEFNQAKLDGFIEKHFPAKYGGPNAHLPVIPVLDIHLHSQLYYELGSNTSIILLWIVGSVGVLILILASINFMNLTTARSTRRAKEVGMRKSLGASRQNLVGQFLGEAMFFSLISVFFGMLIAELFLPQFNHLLDQDLKINYFNNWFTIPAMLTIGLLVGLLSGLYPAFVLSSFKPILALKDSNRNPVGGFLVRKGLVILQFVVVALLLVTIITMQNQLFYIANKDLGYDYKNLVYVRSSDKMGEDPKNYQSFVNELKNSGVIQHVSGVSSWAYQSVEFEGMEPNERKGAIIMTAGADYAQAMGIQLLAGRFPSEDNITDKHSILLNETAIKDLGWDPSTAIGKEITLFEGDSTYTVIGAMKDFHLDNLMVKIESIAIITSPSNFYPVSMIRIPEDQKDEAIAAIRKAWYRFDDGWPFDIYSSKNEVDHAYESIQKLQSLMSELTYIGIFIACMGLYGLAAFSAERRIKEIGIRKVMGASIINIWRLMVSEFTLLVIIATSVGVVAGYFIADTLLQNFAYRIMVGWQIIVTSIIISIGIAVITVSYQAIKSARINPVNTLKTD